MFRIIVGKLVMGFKTRDKLEIEANDTGTRRVPFLCPVHLCVMVLFQSAHNSHTCLLLPIKHTHKAEAHNS